MNRQQTNLGLIGYVFVGTAAVLIPSIMPSITKEFVANGMTLAAIGLIFPAGAVGGILGNILSGIGSDVIGRRRLVWLSALILSAALAFTAGAKLWGLFMVGYVLVSTTQAALSTGINAMIADANRESRARALNILHGVYGAGATVSPLIIGYLIQRGLQWRWALGGVGLIWLTYSIVAYLLSRTLAPEARTGRAQKLDLAMLRDVPFLGLFVIGFIYNGVAVSLLGWVAVFMQKSAGFSTLFSVSMISVFYVALTIGRFLCAAYAERLGYAKTLLVLAFGITLTYPLVVLGINNPLLMVTGVFLTGLSLSGLFPTSLAYGSRLYPEQTGTLSGTLSVALTLGSMIPPLWTGVVASIWSFQVALGVNYLLVLPLIFLALYLGRIERRDIESRDPQLATGATQ
ncbi:MAG: MFS transporter [Chloroflexi bacterium]|nr:MFS transporter [Chloroflexota bacterium]